MTLETAIERVLKIKLAAAGTNLSQWAIANNVERKTAAYQFKTGILNLKTLQPIAATFGLKCSDVLAEAEKLIEAQGAKP